MARALSESEAEAIIFETSFACEQVGTIGTELEWLVLDPRDITRRVPVKEIQTLLGTDQQPLPHGGLVTFEPGGQLELSTKPFPDLGGCLDAATGDMHVLESRLAAGGLTLVGHGLDPRPPQLLSEIPRYTALEAHYQRIGRQGRVMMCNAASVQINVDAGDSTTGWRGRNRRWLLANSLGPVLTAVFANSPGRTKASASVAKSRRQVIRFETDPSRTDPMHLGGEPRATWARYALDALVIGIPEPPPRPWAPPPFGLTMRDWLRGKVPRPVNADDLIRHLKSVIPPVRPCGYLELRMIDTQPRLSWPVPVAVVAALLDDPESSDEALAVVSRLPAPDRREIWTDAARLGLEIPSLATAARRCLEIAIEGLIRLRAPAWTVDAVHRFASTYTHAHRCPADDLQANVWE